MTVNECVRCGTRGYEYADNERRLCHLCTDREARAAAIVSQLEDVYRSFSREVTHSRWKGCEFGKVAIGNAIAGAIRQYDPAWRPK